MHNPRHCTRHGRLFGLGYNIEDFWSYCLEGETDHRDVKRRASILDGLVQAAAAVPSTPVSTDKASGVYLNIEINVLG